MNSLSLENDKVVFSLDVNTVKFACGLPGVLRPANFREANVFFLISKNQYFFCQRPDNTCLCFVPKREFYKFMCRS